MCILIVALVLAPGFTIGYLTAVMQWNGYKVPICIGMLALALNIKTIWTYCRRIKIKTRKGNQHTFHGFAVSDLADFLTQTGAFKKEDAQKRLAMTHTQWLKIADTLEKHGVLERGESCGFDDGPRDVVLAAQAIVEREHEVLIAQQASTMQGEKVAGEEQTLTMLRDALTQLVGAPRALHDGMPATVEVMKHQAVRRHRPPARRPVISASAKPWRALLAVFGRVSRSGPIGAIPAMR